MMKDRPLEAKAVVVTGAGSGLGRAYAMYLAALGCKVVVNDVDDRRAALVRDEISNSGGAAVARVGSVTEVDVAQDLVSSCVDEFGRMDSLVNNAGIYYHRAPWDDPPEMYTRLIEINVLGTMHCGIAFMNHCRSLGQEGVIVNVVSGSQCGLREMGAYSASKGAVASLTYSWAADSASSNIRVNAVSPIGRSGTGDVRNPTLVAPLIAYLVSDDSRGVTGQVFRMNPPELSIMSHPGFYEKSVRVGDWDIASISRVVRDELSGWFQPVGGVLCITGESGRLLGPSQVVGAGGQ
jgi:NAD(P)-dependent dehydrogenase (short-subunit alcohol dehydrogenase family)